MQQRLAPSEPPDVVEIEGVGVAVYHTGKEEQRQLDQGVVHHIQHRAIGGQCVLLAQQADHGDTGHDKADLAQGGAGQDILEVIAEHGDHRAQHHGDGAQNQHQYAPAILTGQEGGGNQQHAEDTGLGQHAGEQCAGRSRRHRMGFGQPDMQGEGAGLGGKSKEDAQGGGPQGAAVLHGGTGLSQLGDHQCTGEMLQDKQAHQRHQTAQHRNGQVGLAGVHGAGRFLLHHPDIGAQAHHLKEQEGGVKLGGQEYACGGAEPQQEEEIVASQIVMPVEILGTEQRGDEPHEAHHRAVDGAEAVHGEVQVQQGDRPTAAEAAEGGAEHGAQGNAGGDDGPEALGPFGFHQRYEQCRDDGEEYHEVQHHSITASRIRFKSPWGNRPSSRQATARSTIGTVIRRPASFAVPSGISRASRWGNHALTATWNI